MHFCVQIKILDTELHLPKWLHVLLPTSIIAYNSIISVMAHACTIFCFKDKFFVLKQILCSKNTIIFLPNLTFIYKSAHKQVLLPTAHRAIGNNTCIGI